MVNKILIVDDDEDLRSELKDFLDGYEVITAASGEEAVSILKRANEIGLVILDVMMPGINGIDLLERIKKTDPGLNVVILTGHSSKDIAISALKNKADDFIEKPIKVDKILDVINRLLGRSRKEQDINSLGLKEKVGLVKQFIERNCFRKTTLKEAAASVCLSPKYVSKIFKENSEQGFTEYKIIVKINASKELLKKSGYNINQISDKLGYENTESFIRQFKKIVNQTPSDYRRKILSPAKNKTRRKSIKRRIRL